MKLALAMSAMGWWFFLAQPVLSADAISNKKEMESTFALRHVTLLDVGLGPGAGEVGASWAIYYHPCLQLEFRVGFFGVGYHMEGGYFSVVQKFLLGNRTHSFLGGIGLATFVVPTKRGYWGYLDLLGYQYRADSGFVFSMSAGLYFNLPSWYESPSEKTNRWKSYPQIRIGVGNW